MQTVKDIRNKFIELYKNKEFVVDKNGGKVIELIGESFLADEESIFGEINKDYVKREIEWYESQSLNVNDIPGGPPKIWCQVSDKDGFINSNYGWMVDSSLNYSQYNHTVEELVNNPFSRRATMIYQRPSMWEDYNRNEMSDFCCTYASQHFIRNNELITYVLMRSCDGIFGYKNDKQWHLHILNKLYRDLTKRELQINKQKIIWTSGSLHIYERHFYLLDNFINTTKDV